MTLVPNTEHLNTLGNTSIFCSEAIYGELLDNFRMKADHQKDQAMSRSLETTAGIPIDWRVARGERLETELVISHVCGMKVWGSESFWGDEHGSTPLSGDKSSCAWAHPDLAECLTPSYSFISFNMQQTSRLVSLF